MNSWQNHAEIISNAMEEMPSREINEFRDLLANKRGTIWVCGNGGSSANAAHFCEDIAKFWDRSVFALGQASSMVTMIGNDFGFEHIFKNEMEWMCKDHDTSEDVFVGVSVSGKSPNVILAAEKASKLGMKVVAITGEEDCLLASNADIVIRVPSQVNGIAEDLQMIVMHWVIMASPEKE